MAAARTYVDFVPSHDLVEDRGKHTLVVNLPGANAFSCFCSLSHMG